MYASRTTQLIVGLFTLLGLGALVFLSLKLGKVELLSPPGYVLYANFDNISGLKTGADVEIAGVNVGRVESIALDQDRARIALRLNQSVKIDDDAVAAIRTRGIIGDKYVAISPGPSDKYLSASGTIRQTESSFVLEDAIGQLINSGAGGGGGGGDKNKTRSEGKLP